MRYLRTNTATIVTVGPFLDKTDGVTLETALTITNERISLTVDLNDGSAPTLVLDNVTGATSGTSNDLNYITNCDAGLMQLELAAANVNYLGRAFLTITDAANHCPVFHEFMILPAMVFDSLIAGTDVLQADMTQILGTAVSTPATAGLLDVNAIQLSGDATAANNAESFFDGTGYAGTNNVIPTVTTVGTTTNLTNLPAAAATAAELAKVPKSDSTVSWNATALAAINAEVDTALNTAIPGSPTANSVNERIATMDGLLLGTIAAGTHNPQTGDSFARIGAAGAGLTALPWNAAWDAEVQSEAQDAITASALATAANLATLAGYVDTEVAAILADTNELQTDLVNGGRLDLLIDAIKAKTDNLPAAPAAVGSAMTLTAAYDAAKTAATQTSVDDLPTNAELATALAGADDAVLAAIGALNNLSSAGAQSAAAAALTAYGAALQTSVDDLEGRLTETRAGYLDNLSGGAVATAAGVSALNNLSQAQAQTAAAAALTAYDPPTNAEMDARTLVAANYATATALATLAGYVDTEVAAIKAVTDKIDTAMVLDGAVYQFTANALELAPTGSGSGATAQEVWEYAGGSGRTINSVSGTVSADVTLWKSNVPSDLDASGFPYVTLANPQQVRDAMKLSPSSGSPSTNSIDKNITSIKIVADQLATMTEQDVSVYRFTENALELAPTGTGVGTSEPAQLDWRAWTTPDGALKDLYDDNAIDVLTGLPSDYAATDGAEYFGSYVMREFDGSLFVGISNLPMNGTGAIIARLDTPGGTPVFEYNLPEEGVSCMAVNPAGTALYATGVDVRDNTERCGFYKRDLAGTWTRRNTLRLYPSEDGFQHVTGIVFVGSRIYVCGQAIDTAIAWSDDDGITWNYSSHVTPRAYSIGAIGTQLYVLGSYDGALYYELARETEPGWADYTNPISTQLGVAKNQMVNWGDYLLFGVDTDELISVDAAGTVVSHSLPFVLRQTYNNLAVDTDGYLCVLGTTGVWRTNDLATWKQVWSFSPADTVRSLGTWGDNLVVSTDGATAQVLARPASPEAAQQQMYRDALKLAASPGTAATGSTDADIADILTDTAAIKVITDAIDVSAVTLATGNVAGDLTFIVGATFDETLTGLTIIPSDWTKCYFSLKREKDSDSDSASLVQIKVTNGGDASDGLLYVQGFAPVSPVTKASASLTVTQSAGTVRIAISAAALALLTGGLSSLDWDLKVFKTGGWSKVVTSGAAEIAWTPTRAV